MSLSVKKVLISEKMQGCTSNGNMFANRPYGNRIILKFQGNQKSCNLSRFSSFEYFTLMHVDTHVKGIFSFEQKTDRFSL